MKHLDVDVLKRVVMELDTLGADGHAECAIAAETGLDEATLLGTSEGFIALAALLLRLALADLANDSAGDSAPFEDGMRAVSTTRLFYEFGSAWPVTAMVAHDKARYEEWKRRLIL